MEWEHTLGEIVGLIFELGIVDRKMPSLEALLSECPDEPLSDYGSSLEGAVLGLFDEAGILYTLDHGTFSGIGECADEDRRKRYEAELRSVAACSRGMVTITDVQLVEDDGVCELEFNCNGAYQYWPVYPGSTQEDVEAALVFSTFLHYLPTGRVEKYCLVDGQILDVGGAAVFTDPKALDRLAARCGLSF